MKYGLILLLSLLMDGAFSSELPQLESSPDGRFGSKCRMGVCHVSIAQLVITPERYHGKLVQVEGIIVVAFEVYGVYSRSGEHQVWVILNKTSNLRIANNSHLHLLI